MEGGRGRRREEGGEEVATCDEGQLFARLLDEEEQERAQVEQQIPGVCAQLHEEQRVEEEREAADDEYEGHYLAEEQSLRDVDM